LLHALGRNLHVGLQLYKLYPESADLRLKQFFLGGGERLALLSGSLVVVLESAQVDLVL